MESHETWREVPGLPGCSVSSLGKVRKHEKEVCLSPMKSGHLACTVFGKTRKVHQLVAAAFIGTRPTDLVTMHKNHRPWDNRAENLAYGTVGDNIRMDFVAGTRSHKGDQAPHRTLSEVDVLEIRSSGLTNKELANIYGIGRPAISKIRRFITWTEVQNAADSFSVGKPPTGEPHMAKAPKTITPADKKIQVGNLKSLLKGQETATKAINAAQKEAEKALNVAKKSADAEIKDAEKAAAAKRKAADAAVALAQKEYAAAFAKAEKAKAAAAKGAEKLAAQLAALEAMPVVAAPKVKAPVKEPAEA